MKKQTEKKELNKAEIVNTICDRIAEGESLRSVLLSEGMPKKSLFFYWISNNTDFADQYARAMECRADVLFEEILEIADEKSGDIITTRDGEEIPNNEFIQRSKLRVDARKWVVARMQPKKYGDKIDVTSDNKAIQGAQIVDPFAQMRLNNGINTEAKESD